ncbi:hypothetical protein K469DRAFT_722069 [Zopfia rhizophila CBS 207.26]|uniref:CFEM domain-containing protein n=1 Tax=Zopfia rhizophila CBS 207.26 TaxID=1314779 RepID=A0A6A6DEP0_9PEZI|nr:hypothetical protein K469DRAFT_722069 [Zopfia rhizophila CBS 207.26]
MRFSSVAIVAALSSLALAQNLLDQLPKCAQDCVGSNFGGCNPFDIPCVCKNKDLISNLSCCVSTKCSQQEQDATIKFAIDLCKAYNIEVPTSASCSAGASSTSAASVSSGASNASSVTSEASTQAPVTAITGASSASTPAAQSTGAAALHTAGAGFGMGVAMAGFFAAL